MHCNAKEIWRAEDEETENYTYAIALQNWGKGKWLQWVESGLAASGCMKAEAAIS